MYRRVIYLSHQTIGGSTLTEKTMMANSLASI
jgi:hypothetical protein